MHLTAASIPQKDRICDLSKQAAGFYWFRIKATLKEIQIHLVVDVVLFPVFGLKSHSSTTYMCDESHPRALDCFEDIDSPGTAVLCKFDGEINPVLSPW